MAAPASKSGPDCANRQYPNAGWYSTTLNLSFLAHKLGAPGLDFETWDTANLNPPLPNPKKAE
jgi:hypothetical protein